MSSEPARWSQPFAALLGAYNAQLGFGLPSIGGKDSMSGTFDEESGKEIDVPPTLVSFAVDVASAKNMISPEFKKAGNKIVVFEIKKDSYDLPDYAQIMAGYDKLHEDIKAGRVISAYAAEANGIAEAVSKMAFGNHLGVKIEHDVDPRDFFAPAWGNIVCEVPADKVGELQMSYRVIGEVTDKAAFEYGNVSIALDEALKTWDAALEDVFPTESAVKKEEVKNENLNQGKFTDINGHWANKAINYVVNKGYFAGVSKTEFAPDKPITRGEFVTVLGRMLKIDTSKYSSQRFNDVNSSTYYSPYVTWANEVGIVSGVGEGNFAPDKALTREEMAVIMSKFLKLSNKKPTIKLSTNFKDQGSISPWAKEAVTEMAKLGVVKGMGEGNFSPKTEFTRAQVAQVLYSIENN